MTNGYMVYLLRILAAQGALASVYTDPEDPEGFSAGFVEAVDGQHVLMCDLSPWGQIDGWRVRRNQDVIQVLAGEEYASLLRESGCMLSVLADAINDKYFDEFGDTVIDFDGETPFVIEDYQEDLRGLLENENT